MYRAMTLKILRQEIDIHDAECIGKVAEGTRIRLVQQRDELRVLVDDQDVTDEIRSQAVTRAVSAVSAVRQVRDVMVREQQRMSAEGGVVLEGRDIGTVVFPSADLKIFMVANLEQRARRRLEDLRQQGENVPLENLVRDISERDQKDSQRDISPLRKADDAIVLDTSTMTVDEQVDFVVSRAKEIVHEKENESQHR